MSSPEFDLTTADDETAITEISFLPDGRICLFGASREVLELLGRLNLGDSALGSRLTSLRSSMVSDDSSTAGINAIAIHEAPLTKIVEIHD
ncbi:MAG: hypothetical protein V4719_06110 [Planctomycetota bacterium]